MNMDPEDMFVKHRDFWIVLREALLSVVDILERKMGMFTTSEMRREYKKMKSNGHSVDIPEK